MKATAKIEFGDFQTPLTLAHQVCELLIRRGEHPNIVVEPTVGRGAFLLAASAAFPEATLNGWEINENYVRDATQALNEAGASSRNKIVQQDFFTCDWEAEFAAFSGEILILGNLPWVTNSGVAVVDGNNLPIKENFLGLRGMAAKTGKSNFDISEWMLIRLLRSLRGRAATFAMLCKTATARKLLRYAWQNDGRIADATIHRIDAAAHFDAAVDACLLTFRAGIAGVEEADVYSSLEATQPASRMGLAGKELVPDIRSYRRLRHLEGLCPFQWRSGLKHDCAAVMELNVTAHGQITNHAGEPLSLESDALFPFLKCSDLANGRIVPRRAVIVTQRFVGDDTSKIAQSAPLTWAYLQSHAERFQARKSSIYKGRAPFSLFGIGEYAFALWKVAVSGLHRSTRFQLLGPVNGKPVFFDDASYYLSFQQESEARLLLDILNAPPCQEFLACLVFPEAKRPITVELLQRLNIQALAEKAGLAGRMQKLQRHSYSFAEPAPQMELVMETPLPSASVFT